MPAARKSIPQEVFGHPAESGPQGNAHSLVWSGALRPPGVETSWAVEPSAESGKNPLTKERIEELVVCVAIVHQLQSNEVSESPLEMIATTRRS